MVKNSQENSGSGGESSAQRGRQGGGDAAGRLDHWRRGGRIVLPTVKAAARMLPTGPVVALSSDGKTAAVAVAGAVQLWDVATGRINRSITGPESGIVSVAFAPDGRIVAARASGRTIHLFNMQTGRVLRQIKARAGG